MDAASNRRARLQVTWQRWTFFLEAMLLIVFAAVALRLFSFPRIARIGSRSLKRVDLSPERRRRIVGWVTRMVAAAARRSPLRALCFEQGLTAQIMLRRRGVDATLIYGVAPAPDLARGVQAHVWVIAEGTDVCGGAGAAGFSPLMTMPGGSSNGSD